MCIAVVAWIASHDREIRFRLRLFVESDGELRSHGPSLTECAIESAIGELDRRGVGTVLRLLEEHVTAKQLDTVLGPEDLELREPVVLDSSPFTRPGHRIAHV